MEQENKPARDIKVIFSGILAVLILAIGIIVIRHIDPGYSKEPLRVEKYLMDTRIEIIAYGRDRELVEKACEDALNEIGKIENIADKYDPDSEISHLNAKAGQGPVKVSEDLLLMLSESISMHEKTGGAFDITIGTIINLWDVNNRKKPPSEEEIGEARAYVGIDKMIVDKENGTVEIEDASLEVDLGGIAKGYAVDRAGHVLEQSGVEAALIHGMSSTLSLGEPTGDGGKRLWRVGIENPRPNNAEDAIMAVLKMGGGVGISTSGDYQRFFEYEGKKYHHIINPVTAKPAEGLISISLIGKASSMELDVFSTALMNLAEDSEDIDSLIVKMGFSAICVTEDGKIRMIGDVPGEVELNYDRVTP